MNFESIKQIKEAILRRYQLFIPMMLVCSLLLVGYAALDKDAPEIKTDVVALNYGEELDFGKIQIDDNQTSYEDLTIEYDTSALDIYKVGASYITVQATDLSNNVASKIIEVMVVDAEKPVYELVANDNCFIDNGVLVINLNSSNKITDYIMAVDNADGDLTAFINQSVELNTNTISRQAIALSVTDKSGNVNEKVFDVEIRDTEAPVLTYVYSDTVEVPYGEPVDINNYVHVSDNSGKVAVFAPTEAIDSTRNEYSYTIYASDESGNEISCPLTIIAKDVTAPVISVGDSYEVTQGNAFNIQSYLSVHDNKDGAVTPTISGSVNTAVAGTYTITITATDTAGNIATKYVTVRVKNSKTGIIATARSKVGSAYVYGASGPSAFDCSGFTQWVFRQNGISIGRTTYAQYAGGQKISYAQAQPGDLLFFNTSSTCGHVAIYLGNGMMVHAGTTTTGVYISAVSSMTARYPLYGVARY